jgi:hypothetical protein
MWFMYSLLGGSCDMCIWAILKAHWEVLTLWHSVGVYIGIIMDMMRGIHIASSSCKLGFYKLSIGCCVGGA